MTDTFDSNSLSANNDNDEHHMAPQLTLDRIWHPRWGCPTREWLDYLQEMGQCLFQLTFRCWVVKKADRIGLNKERRRLYSWIKSDLYNSLFSTYDLPIPDRSDLPILVGLPNEASPILHNCLISIPLLNCSAVEVADYLRQYSPASPAIELVKVARVTPAMQPDIEKALDNFVHFRKSDLFFLPRSRIKVNVDPMRAFSRLPFPAVEHDKLLSELRQWFAELMQRCAIAFERGESLQVLTEWSLAPSIIILAVIPNPNECWEANHQREERGRLPVERDEFEPGDNGNLRRATLIIPSIGCGTTMFGDPQSVIQDLPEVFDLIVARAGRRGPACLTALARLMRRPWQPGLYYEVLFSEPAWAEPYAGSYHTLPAGNRFQREEDEEDDEDNEVEDEEEDDDEVEDC